ncbi:MAG TPA: hypothetical protein VLI39_13110 [Sedimentisphaerales bacterium]|nr:hypothetical protein [Sedimentisphaerales bacterium]
MTSVGDNRTAEALLTVLCPTVCCVGLGVIVHGGTVLSPRSSFFQLGVNALIVGVLVLMARWWSIRRFLAAGAILSVVLGVAAVRSGPRIVFHTVLLMAMWVGVVYVNVRALGQLRGLRGIGLHIAWSIVFGIGLFVSGAVLIVLFRPSDTQASMVFYAQLSVLTGVGMGAGFEVQDRLLAGLRHRSGDASRGWEPK